MPHYAVRFLKRQILPLLFLVSTIAACSTPSNTNSRSSEPSGNHASDCSVSVGSANAPYSVEPQSEAVFDPNTVLLESVNYHKWMEAFQERLAGDTEAKRASAREQLYYLIDSRVKHLTQRDGKWSLPDPDPVLSMLFYWVDELGVHGGDLLVSAIAPTKYADPKSHQKTELPEYLELSLKDGYFNLCSRSDWSVRYPYNFMLWQAGAGATKQGIPVETITLSTGAAKGKGALGLSQATIQLVQYPVSEQPALDASLKLYGMSNPSLRASKDIGKYQSHYAFDEEKLLHKEVLSIPFGNGTLVLLYSGLDGTYQWNRPHFIDFVQQLHIR